MLLVAIIGLGVFIKKKKDMKLQGRCESDLGDFENGKGVHMNYEILKE